MVAHKHSYWNGRAVGAAIQFFIERHDKAKNRPHLEVRLLEPKQFKTEELEGISQVLEVENTGVETLHNCYAPMAILNARNPPRFQLLFDLGGGMRPKIAHHSLDFLEADDHTNLVPNIPNFVWVMVVGKRKSGEIVMNFQSGRQVNDIPIERLKGATHLVLSVRFTGDEYRDAEPRIFVIDLTPPWEKWKVMQLDDASLLPSSFELQ